MPCYADSDGYEKDNGRPFAWRYRDWVINAINRDLRFDIFTVQQIAGDLLTSGDSEFDSSALVATGFHRNTLINTEGGIDKEEDRVKRTIDRTNTLGAVWLGLSVGCANCHTHKYDPISQREYFGLYTFFNNLKEVDVSASKGVASKLAFNASPLEDSPEDTALMVKSSGRQPPAPDAKQGSAPPPDADLFQAVSEETKPRESYVHLRGDFLSKGPTVEPHTLEALPTLKARGAKPDRLDLARWVASADNPLTARVIANRIWQIHFGRGLVFTGDDFGTQGEPPSHADLLDWLASELLRNDWKLKPFHRLIVTSATYRQASDTRPEIVERDPYNTWLSRQNRLRVDAEIVRDLALATSGLLNSAIGGPSVRPPQPPGVSSITFNNKARWTESGGPDRYRRGMYIWFQRTSPYPSLVGFDAPDSILTCTRRERSNSPLQALALLNDVTFVECSQALGRRLVADNSDDVVSTRDPVDARIRRAFKIALSREPSQSEIDALHKLYEETEQICRAEPSVAKAVVGTNLATTTHDAGPTSDFVDAAACVAVARAIINLDEFITRE